MDYIATHYHMDLAPARALRLEAKTPSPNVYIDHSDSQLPPPDDYLYGDAGVSWSPSTLIFEMEAELRWPALSQLPPFTPLSRKKTSRD